MSKKRVYQLAQELGVENKDILDILTKHNISVNNHFNSLEDSEIKIVQDELKHRTVSKEKEFHTPVDITKKSSQQESEVTPNKKDVSGISKGNQDSTKVEKSEFRTVTIHNSYKEDQKGMKERRDHQERSQKTGQDRNRNSYNDRNRQEHNRNERNRNDRNRNERNRNEQNKERNRDQRKERYQGNNSRRDNQGSTLRRDNQRSGNVSRDVTITPDLLVPIDTGKGAEFKKKKDFGNKDKDYRKTFVETEEKELRSSKKEKRKEKKKDGKGRPQSLVSTAMAKSKNKVKQRNEQNRQMKEKELEKAKAAIATEIELDGPLTVKELSEKMGREVSEIIKKLMLLGVMATINQEIDLDTATLIAEDFGVTVIEVAPKEDPTEIEEIEDAPESLQLRPPVVTIMGHVDHGKTSLLDVIRRTNVTASEAGGITQHIGAYMVRYQGNKITFLDTPGHEAFTAMRLRGAQSTDIAVLVVAADDGVMPQTIEAINHAKSANIPILVAINKMDKPGANPDHVKQQLAEHGLLPEEWGGDIIMVPVSAKKQEGIDDLLENILLVAEVMELKANPNRNAMGVVIEAQLDKGRGPVCTLLVQKGTLHVGDTIIAGTAYGKVRAMTNERGEKVKAAKPSMPVEVLGLSDVPLAGEIMHVVDDNTARNLAEKRAIKLRAEELKTNTKVTLDDIFKQIQEGELKELNIIIKADVQGSVEALRQSLESIKNPEVRIVIVHSAVGAINESDVMLASASNAIIIGFNVRPDATVRKSAEKESVDLRTYRVIYDAINDVEKAMVGMLTPEFKEVILGRAEVRQVISTPKAIVAGAYVTDGKITNSSEIRLIRDGIVVHEGHIDSLRRFKDEVKEVANGYECGISIEKYRDIKENDVIEAFTMEEIAPTL